MPIVQMSMFVHTFGRLNLTDAGEKLQDKALCVPETIAQEFHLTQEEASTLYRTLYKMLDEERMRTNKEE